MTCAIGAFNNGIGSRPKKFDHANGAAKFCAGRLLPGHPCGARSRGPGSVSPASQHLSYFQLRAFPSASRRRPGRAGGPGVRSLRLDDPVHVRVDAGVPGGHGALLAVPGAPGHLATDIPSP